MRAALAIWIVVVRSFAASAFALWSWPVAAWYSFVTDFVEAASPIVSVFVAPMTRFSDWAPPIASRYWPVRLFETLASETVEVSAVLMSVLSRSRAATALRASPLIVSRAIGSAPRARSYCFFVVQASRSLIEASTWTRLWSSATRFRVASQTIAVRVARFRVALDSDSGRPS